MKFQVVITKKSADWQTRKDSESVEKYDNDLPDGFHYVGVNGPAKNEAEIEDAIMHYGELRTQKADNSVVLPVWSRINWLVETARKELK